MAPTLIFTAGVIFILYTLFGYPLLLSLLSRRGRGPVRKQPLRASVSVILPVRNGEQWVRQKLQSIIELRYPRDLVEVLVVSDGSTDRTAAIARSSTDEGVRVLEIPHGGKAAAITAALEFARGDILFFTDVRQRLEPDSLSELVSCFADPSVGAVSGELVILEGDGLEEANTGLYWRYEKWIRTRLSMIDSIYGATGCIYAMRRELAVPIPAGVLLDDVYEPLAAFFKGYRVILDCSAKAFDLPTKLDAEFHRKVRTLAGVYQVVRYYPALLGPGNRMWLHFVSHKLGRLLLPWAMLIVFASSFGLPGMAATIAIVLQVGFYGVALIDPWVPDHNGLRRLTSPVRTFTVLMLAALFAPFALFVPAERVWKHTRVSPARTIARVSKTHK